MQFGISAEVAEPAAGRSGAVRAAAGSQRADTVAGMHAGSLTDTFPKQAAVSSARARGPVTSAQALTAGCAAAEEAQMHRLGATLQ